jgi:hypothetical protein
MNFVGHHEVAARAGLDGAGRLGAMLPDFATMLGVRLQRDVLSPDVRAGVALHHATDAVFHGDEQVLAGMHALTASLAAVDVPRGAARAIGHIGYEMLLDGWLGAADLRGALAADDPEVAKALADHAEWPGMRGHLATRVAYYDDPDWVADRLFHILARRPRLAFPPEQRPAVAAVLATMLPDVRDAAPTVFATVTSAVLVVAPHRRFGE